MFLINRNGYYYVEYFDTKLKKSRRISTQSTSKKEAYQFISNLESKLKEQEKIVNVKVVKFQYEYLSLIEQTRSKKYLTSVRLSFRQMLSIMGDKYLIDVNQRELETFLLTVHSKSKYAAHLYLRTLKAAFNKAIEWGYLKENLLAKIKLPKIPKKYPLFISKNDLNIINDNTPNVTLKDIYTLAFNTGMRLNEILNLTWPSVDLKGKRITINITDLFITKNKSERTIPINVCLYKILDNLYKQKKSQYVFVNKNMVKFNDDYISKEFKKAVIVAKLDKGIHFHSLRHSFASNLVQKGVPLYVIKELLGHENLTTTQIYAHLANENLADAVNMLDRL